MSHAIKLIKKIHEKKHEFDCIVVYILIVGIHYTLIRVMFDLSFKLKRHKKDTISKKI